MTSAQQATGVAWTEQYDFATWRRALQSSCTQLEAGLYQEPWGKKGRRSTHRPTEQALKKEGSADTWGRWEGIWTGVLPFLQNEALCIPIACVKGNYQKKIQRFQWVRGEKWIDWLKILARCWHIKGIFRTKFKFDIENRLVSRGGSRTSGDQGLNPESIANT